MEIEKELTGVEIICHTLTWQACYKDFHWHENIEICRIKNKTCRFLIDGEPITAKPGDFIAVSPRVVHRFLIDEDESCIRIFQISPKTILDMGMPVKPLKKHISAEEIKQIPRFLERVEALFDMMEQENRAKKSLDNPFLQSIAVAIYQLFLKEFKTEESEASAKEQRIFYEIVEYVNGHIKEELSVQSVANQLYLSRGIVGTVFLKYAGVKLSEYISTARVKCANEMIDRGYSITRAAMESGFRSIRTFHNAYKKVMGTAPREYRKK